MSAAARLGTRDVVDATPATSRVLGILDSRTIAGIHSRHALLALAVLADRDRSTPNGLDAVSADRVARVVGLARSTVERTLRGLAASEHTAVVLVTSYAGTRRHRWGDDVTLQRGERVVGYRFAPSVYL